MIISYLNDLMDKLWWCFHSFIILVWHLCECSSSIWMGVHLSFRFSNDPGKYNLHFRHLIMVNKEMLVDDFAFDSFLYTLHFAIAWCWSNSFPICFFDEWCSSKKLLCHFEQICETMSLIFSFEITKLSSHSKHWYLRYSLSQMI